MPITAIDVQAAGGLTQYLFPFIHAGGSYNLDYTTAATAALCREKYGKVKFILFFYHGGL